MVKLAKQFTDGRGRALGCALLVMAMLFAAGVWLNFALAYERERAVSRMVSGSRQLTSMERRLRLRTSECICGDGGNRAFDG